MNDFQEGQVVYHKATLKRCVVIKKTENGMIVVRDEDNEQQHYYPQELKPERSSVVTTPRKSFY